jgi:hypothetical protein
VKNHNPRISFLIIVLNGEPFTKYCLRSLYPFAHQIVVVEGAAPGASAFATPQGHSSDGTLEALYQFKEDEDRENRLLIIVRDGLWSEKDEMSSAGAEVATGDYLWQVDIDEFYKPDDMKRVLDMLAGDPTITAVSFSQIQFWGGFSYYVDGWYLRRGGDHFDRLFRWGPGHKYITHRPPTVINEHGEDTRSIKWVSGYELRLQGIFLYHYSLVFPKQVVEKSEYYDKSSWTSMSSCRQWTEDVFTNLRKPLRIHNVPAYPGWLERFHHTHPPQIQVLQSNLEAGLLHIQIRPTKDIEKLLRSPGYRLAKTIVRALTPPSFRPVTSDRSLTPNPTAKSPTRNNEKRLAPPAGEIHPHEATSWSNQVPKVVGDGGLGQSNQARDPNQPLTESFLKGISGKFLYSKKFPPEGFLIRMLRLLRNPNATPFLKLEKFLNWISRI